MSDITTTAQDAIRQLHVRVRIAMQGAAERARDQRGQTAAEYMGILLIVSLIIGALMAANVHHVVRDAVDNLIKDIGNGRDDKAGV